MFSATNLVILLCHILLSSPMRSLGCQFRSTTGKLDRPRLETATWVYLQLASQSPQVFTGWIDKRIDPGLGHSQHISPLITQIPANVTSPLVLLPPLTTLFSSQSIRGLTSSSPDCCASKFFVFSKTRSSLIMRSDTPQITVTDKSVLFMLHITDCGSLLCQDTVTDLLSDGRMAHLKPNSCVERDFAFKAT